MQTVCVLGKNQNLLWAQNYYCIVLIKIGRDVFRFAGAILALIGLQARAFSCVLFILSSREVLE